MEQITKRDLRDRWNVRFKQLSDSEVEVSVPCWSVQGRDTVRVVAHYGRTHDDAFSVNLPAKGRWANGYDARMDGKLDGYGFKSIVDSIEYGYPYGMSFVRRDPVQVQVWASAINVARLMLRRSR